MFRKILIANRGEIACRVIATARRMGVATVAVYSDADARARHVAMADEAVHIGPAAAAESYLLGARIIEAAQRTGAEAIHPGYGFLSENPEFVSAVEDAGLVFIGPSADAITAMGLKDAAKALMIKAGVPVVPGYHGENQDADVLAAEAEKIGYPVLIKARAGGGGKGMRLVEEPGDFRSALEGAQREGQASFGDPVCLIEKYVTRPRHIEFQVFGDAHGTVVHMFERDCSLQRRHQKVIEEAPAPDMPDAVRAAMGQAAIDAAKAVGYQGAGTVEFIVDGSGPLREDGFWFMEMNTRLQVEHPVSEAITGLDFVELQLRVAAGEALPVTQDDLRIDGWAMEARVYAEDVAKGFLPATGSLRHLHFPDGVAFEQGAVRIDSGVCEGDEISPWYDPMIAKVIVHATSRDAACGLLTETLDQCRVTGCITNVEFLSRLARHEGFARGDVDTGLIARDMETLTAQPAPDVVVRGLAAIGTLGVLPESEADPWNRMLGWRHWGAAEHQIQMTYQGGIETVLVCIKDTNTFNVADLELHVITELDGYRVTVDGHQFGAQILVEDNGVTVFANGQAHVFGRIDPLEQAGDDLAGGDAIIAPMPGLVSRVHVAVGDQVAKGDALVILEAMKMEHTLVAARDGVIAEMLCSDGDQVSDGSVLVQLEPEGTADE